jgi:hypothetical protein
VHHLLSKSSPAAAPVDGAAILLPRPLWVDGQDLQCGGTAPVGDHLASVVITLSGELQFPYSLRTTCSKEVDLFSCP